MTHRAKGIITDADWLEVHELIPDAVETDDSPIAADGELLDKAHDAADTTLGTERATKREIKRQSRRLK